MGAGEIKVSGLVFGGIGGLRVLRGSTVGGLAAVSSGCGGIALFIYHK